MTMSRGQKAPELVGRQRLQGRFKKVRSARPQAAKEDEAYGESTSSLPSNENAAGGFFQQTLEESWDDRG